MRQKWRLMWMLTKHNDADPIPGTGSLSLSPNPFTNPSDFLRNYWQKKPLLIRQAFPDFTPELDADDIAGLACDDLAESRLVSGSFPEHDWDLRFGPFTEADLSGLAQTNWTLLVQDVEKHFPPLHSLLEKFSFLPTWRIDDLMISVAGPGGSVGPHSDQYDVFLLQVTGKRKWQIAESFSPALLPDCELNVLNKFTPEQEWILEPGDLLYLPPGVAHHGIAMGSENPVPAGNKKLLEGISENGSLTPISPISMTWSIGMRAPSTADLLQSLGEWLAQNHEEGPRYGDNNMLPPERTGEIDAHAIERFVQLLEDASKDSHEFRSFLGSFLSSYRLAHDPAPPAKTLNLKTLGKALEQGAIIQQHPWTRLAWLLSGSGAILFAAGEEYPCTPDIAENICKRPVNIINNSGMQEQQLKLICELINQGHLYLQE